MDSVLSVIQSPMFIGTVLFLGVASLVRILSNRDPSMKRAYSDDRRSANNIMPATPFCDSDGIEVIEDRRVLADRRQHGVYAVQEEVGQDGVLG